MTEPNTGAAREIARDAIVLLTNRPVGAAPALPLRKNIRSLAVIGRLANDSGAPLGSWHGAGRREDVVTVLAGLRNALPNVQIGYAPGVPLDTVPIDDARHDAGHPLRDRLPDPLTGRCRRQPPLHRYRHRTGGEQPHRPQVDVRPRAGARL